MRRRIGIVALVLAVGFLGWSWGNRHRTESELNRVYYPGLFCAAVRVVDARTQKPVDFAIKWTEAVSPGIKGTEPTQVIDKEDGSKFVVLVRRYPRENYTFNVSAPGYKEHSVTLKEDDRSKIQRSLADVTIEIPLEPISERVAPSDGGKPAN